MCFSEKITQQLIFFRDKNTHKFLYFMKNTNNFSYWVHKSHSFYVTFEHNMKNYVYFLSKKIFLIHDDLL